MAFDMFRVIIDQFVALGGGCVYFSPTVGDALIDGNLSDKIAYAKRFPEIKEIYLFTNGILLNRERFDEIVDAGLKYLMISMSGFDPAEYERIYRVRFYRKVIENLCDISASDRFAKCKTEIGLRTGSLFPALKSEYRHLRHLGYKISRTVFFDNWAGRIKQDNLTGFMFIRPLRKKRNIPCHMLYAGPMVQQDGEIVACGCRDVDADSELRLGNIKDTTLYDAWLDGTMDNIRERFIDGDFPDICRDCRHYLPVSRDRLLL